MSRCDFAHIHWMPLLSFALFHLQKSWSTRICSIHISCFLVPVSNTMNKCGLRYRIFLMFITNDISSENIFIPKNQSHNQEARFHLWASLCVCVFITSMRSWYFDLSCLNESYTKTLCSSIRIQSNIQWKLCIYIRTTN